MKIKKFEAYNFEDENYDDFAEEHAKVVVAEYIDAKVDGLQLAFDNMSDRYDLIGAAGDNSLKIAVKDALINLLKDMLDEANDIDVDEYPNSTVGPTIVD